ncbi:MAG TPA: hypothetical protein VKA40_05370 [Nitrososphaera sp.]|jgi:hypothetical protein|nr:hypothetical protein [Nitrososphaera sp.]
MSTNNQSSSGNNNCHDKYTITARDLLQANATIIAGALILLTIATSSDRPLTLLDVIIVSLGILPFVISCRFLLERSKSEEYGFRMARHLTYYGLLGLVAVIVYFLGLSRHT